MHPVLFQVGSFKLHSFGVMMVLAFFVGLAIARQRAPRFGLDANKISDAALWMLLWAVLGARLAYLVQNIGYYSANPNELLSLQFQGLTSFGGILFAVLYLYFWAKKTGTNLLKVFDTLAPAMLVGHAIGRVGCYLNGCCHGVTCSPETFLALYLPGQKTPVYPAQLYDTVLNLIGFAFLIWREKKGLALGQVGGLFLMLHGTARFIYEYWRIGATAERLGSLPISEAQAVSLVMFAIGVAMYVRFQANAGAHQEVGVA